MKLNFNTENIRKNKIELLDCQVDLILRSLEFYAYTYHFIYPRKSESETDEENLRKSLVTDTYHQILSEYNESRKNNPIEPNLKFLDKNNIEFEKNKVKIA